MDRKRQKLTLEKNDVHKECHDAKITALERKFEHMEKKLKLNDVQRECQDEKITSLERKLEHMENKLKLVIAELEKVKEERARDKINFETEKCELEFKMDKYKEQCNQLQSESNKLQNENEKLQDENKRLQNYLQDLESANIKVEEKSQMYNTDLNSQITKVQESNDDALDFNSLPNEIILNVFAYFEQNQLGQIARVCRRWSVLTKSPLLWKNVNVKISPSHGCQTAVAESFINGLPSCVTTIRLHFTDLTNSIERLDFAALCLRLQQKCPHLEELMLTNSKLSNSLPAVIGLCTQFLQNVKKLIFHFSSFLSDRSTDESFGISKIKILKLLDCYFLSYKGSPFSKLLHLKQLHLFHTIVPDSWFEDDASFLNQLHVLNVGQTYIESRIFSTIQHHGHNLQELYLCLLNLRDDDLTFTDSAFPHLKTICLSHNFVTCDGVVSLIQSCPSLENVYVYERVAESFSEHPFVVANRSKSRIVKAIHMIHKHNVDYSHT